MGHEVTRRDFIHQMSATLGLLAITYRSVGVTPPPMAAQMTWMGDAFATHGELPALQKFALGALAEGERDAAFDWMLAAASLVDAPAAAYRETLASLRSVCLRSDRPRAATTMDWYLGTPTAPRELFDAGWTRVGERDLTGAAVAFDQAGLPAHAAYALERVGAREAARERYAMVARKAEGLPRALAVLGFARLGPSSPARDRALDVAIEHALQSLNGATPSVEDVADALEQRSFFEENWTVGARAAADRFRFLVAPPWVQPILDGEVHPDIARLCTPILVHRQRVEARVTASAADFALRRWMVTRLVALELETAGDDRAMLLRDTLRLRLDQLGDRRLARCLSECRVARSV